jgi:hypothetical protein
LIRESHSCIRTHIRVRVMHLTSVTSVEKLKEQLTQTNQYTKVDYSHEIQKTEASPKSMTIYVENWEIVDVVYKSIRDIGCRICQ